MVWQGEGGMGLEVIRHPGLISAAEGAAFPGAGHMDLLFPTVRSIPIIPTRPYPSAIKIVFTKQTLEMPANIR